MEKNSKILSPFTAFCAVTVIFAIVVIYSWINSLIQAHGLISLNGEYVGRDFLPFYAAAKQVIAGNIYDLYTESGAYRATRLLVPESAYDKTIAWPWPYPPHYFLLISPFAFLPYYSALALWLFISILLPGFAIWNFAKVRSKFLLLAIFNINVLICLNMGQNALIFSSLAAIGILSLKNNPILSGICFAIASMKPHFALLIPFALVLGGYWKALLYTVLSTLVLIIVSCLLFGWDILFVTLKHFSGVKTISFLPAMWIFSVYSTYRALLNLGFAPTYAWAGHFVVASAALYFLQNIWRKDYSITSKWLALGIAALLFTPFSFAYDAVWITLPAMVFFYYLMENKIRDSFIYGLIVIQIFAFAIVSISNLLSILVIISALALLVLISQRKYDFAI